MVNELMKEQEAKRLIHCGNAQVLVPIDECLNCSHNFNKKITETFPGNEKNGLRPQGYTLCGFPVRKDYVVMVKGLVK